MNKSKNILSFLLWVLIIFSSTAIILTITKAINCPFFLNYYIGFIKFINLLEPFKILFASTFVVVTAKYSIEQLFLIKESNINFIKGNERNQWISFLIPYIETLSKTDFNLRTDLQKKLPSIHDYLFKINYTIRNKKELKDFFDTFFINKIEKYEQNLFCLNIHVYPNNDYSYSFDNFNQIFILMINEENSYAKIQEDLRGLYIAEVRKTSNALINQTKWAEAAMIFKNKFNFD